MNDHERQEILRAVKEITGANDCLICTNGKSCAIQHNHAAIKILLNLNRNVGYPETQVA